MRFESTPEQQAKMLKLIEYFSGLDEGAEKSWLAIEHDTGIVMDSPGRSMARRALYKSRGRTSHISVRGEGIVIPTPRTVMDLVDEKGRRVRGAVVGFAKAVTEAREKFEMRMPADDRQRVQMLAGFVGALRAHAAGCVPRALPRKGSK